LIEMPRQDLMARDRTVSDWFCENVSGIKEEKFLLSSKVQEELNV
jgi:hypothetical protein